MISPTPEPAPGDPMVLLVRTDGTTARLPWPTDSASDRLRLMLDHVAANLLETVTLETIDGTEVTVWFDEEGSPLLRTDAVPNVPAGYVCMGLCGWHGMLFGDVVISGGVDAEYRTLPLTPDVATAIEHACADVVTRRAAHASN